MTTKSALGATVAVLQSAGTGLAAGTNAILAGVGGATGGAIAMNSRRHTPDDDDDDDE